MKLIIFIFLLQGFLSYSQTTPVPVTFLDEPFSVPKQPGTNSYNNYWNFQVKDYNRWEIVEDTLKAGNSYLKLTVQDSDHVLCNGCLDRTRAEIALRPYHPEGSTYTYSWRFMLPAIQFPDHSTSGSGFCVLAQFLPPVDRTYSCGSANPPVIELLYKGEPDVENDERLILRYGRSCPNSSLPEAPVYRELRSIDKSKWINIRLSVKWSSKPEEGSIEVWVNGNAVNLDGTNKILRGANMYNQLLDNGIIMSEGTPNNFKMGIYRKGNEGAVPFAQTILIDNFKLQNNTTYRMETKPEILQGVGDSPSLNAGLKACTYKIYTQTGSEVSIQEQTSSGAPDLNKLAEGMYIVKSICPAFIKTEKVVIYR